MVASNKRLVIVNRLMQLAYTHHVETFTDHF